jgi:tetratricopeptide (TPR) repeat protein/cell division protein FtsB
MRQATQDSLLLRRKIRLAIVAVFSALALIQLPAAHADTAAAPQRREIAALSRARQKQALSNVNAHVTDLERQVEDLRGIVQLLLAPLGALIGILALGGALGVVFSIRDQRRQSQIHELAVLSETSGQRRTDESYTLFLDASQRTLTLVNDTLQLAREATDRASHTMELKAESSLGAIEQEAQKLILPLLDAGEFEAVVENRDAREQLQVVAGDLSALEGYLLLQDIDLHPFSRFVKGIDHHLADETDEALQTLLKATQDDSVGELQRFSRYWVGYLRNTLGEHEKAAEDFEMAKENLPPHAIQTFELDRIIAETRFFERAASSDAAGARERFEEAEHLLRELEEVAGHLYDHDHVRSTDTSHEVAASRAALLTWIAYEGKNLVRPISSTSVSAADDMTLPQDEKVAGMVPIAAIKDSTSWSNLSSEALRAWALRETHSLYTWQEESENDFAISFGQAESDFFLSLLGDHEEGVNTYRRIERMALDRLPWHREPRETAELAQAVFICRGRLHELRRISDDVDLSNAAAELASAYADVQRALGAIGDRDVTIYSHLQKRPLRHHEFQEELEEFEAQILGAGAQNVSR